jgi:hypothetical protein
MFSDARKGVVVAKNGESLKTYVINIYIMLNMRKKEDKRGESEEVKKGSKCPPSPCTKFIIFCSTDSFCVQFWKEFMNML